MSERRQREEQRAENFPASEEWEWWSIGAVAIAVVFAVSWILALARLGMFSLYVHGIAIPVLGGLSVPVVLWGLVRSIWNPPFFRTRRLVGFVSLVVVGFFGTNHVVPAPVSTGDREPEGTYRLPFRGEWYTLAGGSTLERNYHAANGAFRWAYDFTVLEEGKRFEGNEEYLEDYFCFGEPVYAPVSGTVVEVEEGHPDRRPRNVDPNSILGNYLVIEVSNREYLYMAHLKYGSIRVEEGRDVERGRELAACGNSGRTMKPHLHIHLQDRLAFPWAQGLPLRFHSYRADGKSVDIGMPRGERDGARREGQRVEPL